MRSLSAILAMALGVPACALSHSSDAEASMDAGAIATDTGDRGTLDEGFSCGHACEPCCPSAEPCLPLSGYTTGFCSRGYCLSDPPCDAALWTDAGP